MKIDRFFDVIKGGDKVIAVFNEDCKKIDAKNYTDIESDALALVDNMEEKELIFDLSNVVYVSSAGLRMFSTVGTQLAETGTSYRLTNLKEDILKMFELTGYSGMFRVEGKQAG